MNRRSRLSGLLISLLIFQIPVLFAQDEKSNKESGKKSVQVPAGQEVEVNEDNYRQFMELRDTRGQRNMLPENAFKPGSGTQKLDKLPEESQKHLRNQLREIIVQGDRWQPGDENTQYPYVPSDAAGNDSSLQKQEAEAWGELVENYHQREAEIYKNSARTQAAMAAGASRANAGNNGESGGSSSGQGGSGQGGEGQEQDRPTQGEQGGAADSYAPNAQNDPNATSTQGVTQNAMEFLSGNGQLMANTGENSSSSGQSGQNNGPTKNTNQGEAQDQQGELQENQPGNNSSERVASTSSDVQAKSVTGSAQNALKYLKGGQNQDSQGEGNLPGDQPLPELPALTVQVPSNTQDTLTIQDLMNAQGVRNATGTGSPPPGGTIGPEPVNNDPDKETDG